MQHKPITDLDHTDIHVIDDIFPHDVLNDLAAYAMNSHRWGFNNYTNGTNAWAMGVVGYPEGYGGGEEFEEQAKQDWEDRKKELPAFEEMWNIIKKKSPVGKLLLDKPTRSLFNGHVSAHGNYAHTDAPSMPGHGVAGMPIYTHIICLNKTWSIDTGGATEFYNIERTEIIKSVIPQYGRMIVFDGRIPHAGKPPCKFYNGLRLNLAWQCKVSDIDYTDSIETEPYREYLKDSLKRGSWGIKKKDKKNEI
mgnify:CR=1 FL=1